MRARPFIRFRLQSSRLFVWGCAWACTVGVLPRPGSMPVWWSQGGGGAPVLRPSLAGHCLWRACRTSINTVVPCMRCGDREWGLRPGAPPPPCESSVTCHAFACHLTFLHAGRHACTPATANVANGPIAISLSLSIEYSSVSSHGFPRVDHGHARRNERRGIPCRDGEPMDCCDSGDLGVGH